MDCVQLILVDGFNLLHAVILKGKVRQNWWSCANQERVVRLAETFASETGRASVLVVFDCADESTERFLGEASVSVRFHPDADDAIVSLARENQGQTEVVIVSADRALVDRAKQFGATRLSPWQFAERCQGRPAQPSG